LASQFVTTTYRIPHNIPQHSQGGHDVAKLVQKVLEFRDDKAQKFSTFNYLQSTTILESVFRIKCTAEGQTVQADYLTARS